MPICKHKNSSLFLTVLFLLFMLSNVQATDAIKVKFAIMTLGTPSQKYANWNQFIEYLKVKTGYDIDIVTPNGFDELEQEIDKNNIDLFFSNSFLFYRLKQKGKAEALAQMQNINGSIMSHSEIFVRADSGINKIEDLKGKKFSFVNPLGAGGYLAPRAMFQKHGINTKKDLTEHFTRNVANTIHSVMLNEVQAGTMCGINYKLLSKKLDTAKLKVIAVSDSYPEGLIATKPGLTKAVREKLKFYITGMLQDKKGNEILKAMEKTHGMKIQQFINYDAKVEKITQSLIKQSGIQ